MKPANQDDEDAPTEDLSDLSPEDQEDQDHQNLVDHLKEQAGNPL